jgi:hypothetical protein
MTQPLDNKSADEQDLPSLERSIAEMVQRLDQHHPIERKLKFFLDIRGYLKLNALRGTYMEFGSFRSWTQYSAFRILEATAMLDAYVGLDAFVGEPEPNSEEALHMPTMQRGDFGTSFANVSSFVREAIGEKGHLIRGDFRDTKVMQEALAFIPISVAMIDCNLLSSLEAATQFVMAHARPGCVMLVDDYFTNFGQGQARVPDMCERLASEAGWRLLDHSFYPPFAKSFILVQR